MNTVTKTPEQHHSELIDAIEHELTTHGPASLADVIATLVGGRVEDEDASDRAAQIRQAAREFENLGWRLAKVGPLTEGGA